MKSAEDPPAPHPESSRVSGYPPEQNTIVAIATPPGRGGIGIVRLSGPRARAIAEPLLRLSHPLAPGRARFAELLDPTPAPANSSPKVLDQAVVTFFAAPHSYTSDDVVEISLHGSPVLLDAVLRHSLAHGARLAEPGEFTRRAFLSGRLDLTAAEAVRDLIDASTLHQARIAAAQLGGSVSRGIAPIKRDLLTLIATLEAGIDFAEDDLDVAPASEILFQLAALTASLRTLAAGFCFGRILREGVTIALAGQPNAGKSSLFNHLLGRDRAIVTAQPGTTRDPVTDRLDIGGIPVELIDTAGLRDLPAGPTHEAERAGIARTRTALAEAHHVLLIVDAATLDPAAAVLNPEDRETLASLADRPVALVLNKADLLSPSQRRHMEQSIPSALLVSATSGEGIPVLRAMLEHTLTRNAPAADALVITSLRQQQAVTQAIDSLEAATAAQAAGVPHEMLLLDLYAALAALDELSGTSARDAVLQEIFATFCIGK